ncbi:MAG: glycosyltransferase family 39 protein [Chloroflexota bacterium]|nr:glycosyltransferase family 39 protein [Chloroflexota bacterium]
MTTRTTALDRNWLVVAILSAFAWAPLLYPGFFQSQSGLAAIYRVSQPAAAGTFFPVGPGDSAPLAWALAGMAHALGLGAAESVRLVFGLALLASGLTMYLAARRLLGPAGGLVAALVYAYLPYVLAVVYARGTLPEAVAVALLPLALWAMDLASRPVTDVPPSPMARLKPPALVVTASLLLALAHPGLCLAALPLLLAFGAYSGGRRALGLSGIGMVPGATASLALLWPLAAGAAPVEPADLYRLFSPAWQAGPGDTPLQLGVVAVVLALLAGSEWFPGPEAASDGGKEDVARAGADAGPHTAAQSRPAGFFAAATITLLVLMLPPAAPLLWPALHLHLQAVLPQPWLLLGVAAVTLSLTAGAALTGRRWGPMLAEPAVMAALVAAILLASYSYLAPRNIRAADLPDPSRAPVARFEDSILLADYHLEQPAGARTIRLTLFWQALAPVQGDYTVFTHLLDAQGAQQGQKDAKPLAGARPTTTWARGEVLVDVYEIALSPQAVAGAYVLEMGLYQPEKDRRVPQVAPKVGATEIRLPVAVR